MAYTRTWNAAYEASPPGGQARSLGDDRIRDAKTDIRERMEKDHYMAIAGTDADHGEHEKVTFQAPIAKPSNVANKAFLYGKDVSAKIELHWEDEDGNEIQLTSAGEFIATIPSGKHILFYEDSAPVGWTIKNTLDDKLVFVTKGSVAGGDPGGAAHTSGTWTQPNHTHGAGSYAGPSHTHAAGTYVGPSHTHTGPSHTHTGPSHTHKMGVGYVSGTTYFPTNSVHGTSGSFAATRAATITTGTWNPAEAITSAGGTGNTGASGTGATGAQGTGAVTGASAAGGTASVTGTSAGGATANTWRPAAYNCIVCVKD